MDMRQLEGLNLDEKMFYLYLLQLEKEYGRDGVISFDSLDGNHMYFFTVNAKETKGLIRKKMIEVGHNQVIILDPVGAKA